MDCDPGVVVTALLFQGELAFEDGDPILIDGEPKLWDIFRSARERFLAANDPIRINLELFIALRHKVEHRYGHALRAAVGGRTHALVINFEQELGGRQTCELMPSRLPSSEPHSGQRTGFRKLPEPAFQIDQADSAALAVPDGCPLKERYGDHQRQATAAEQPHPATRRHVRPSAGGHWWHGTAALRCRCYAPSL